MTGLILGKLTLQFFYIILSIIHEYAFLFFIKISTGCFFTANVKEMEPIQYYINKMQKQTVIFFMKYTFKKIFQQVFWLITVWF